MSIKKIEHIIQEHITVQQRLLENKELLQKIEKIVERCISCFQEGKRVFFCGNGGSAADAQHLAAEFSGRFYIDRKPLPAMALQVNSSYLTAVANDYGYNEVFARMLEAQAQSGDLLFAISTSGNSPNIQRVIEKAQEIGVYSIGMTGSKGGALREKVDMLVNIPSDDTPRIQEGHILVGHIICQLVEEVIFAAK